MQFIFKGLWKASYIFLTNQCHSNKLNFSWNGHLCFEGAFQTSTKLHIELFFMPNIFVAVEPGQDSMNGSTIYILNFLAFVGQISKFSIYACVMNSEFICQNFTYTSSIIKNSILLYVLNFLHSKVWKIFQSNEILRCCNF